MNWVQSTGIDPGVGVGGKFLFASFFEPQQGYRWGEGRAIEAQLEETGMKGSTLVAVRGLRAQWKCCLETKGHL